MKITEKVRRQRVKAVNVLFPAYITDDMENCGLRAFSVATPIPEQIRKSEPLECFKSLLKTCHFEQAYC